MIRRELTSPDAGPTWLIVSQVEHARLSATLARGCRLSLPNDARHAPVVAELRQEMLDAIERHDDGWAEWEAKPTLDAQHGRPLSFQEVPAGEAIEVWSRSIESAAGSGPLAASMVAGHFVRLAELSQSPKANPRVERWKHQVQQQRADWLQAWAQPDPASRTPAAAERAVDWLQLFDILSLWLCYAWPIATKSAGREAISWASAGRELPLPTEFVELPRVAPRADLPFPVGPSTVDGGADPYLAEATIRPWRFTDCSVDVVADAQLIPARRYASAAQLGAAARPCRLAWRLIKQP